MARAVIFRELGGPEVLQLEDVEIAEPGEGEVQVRFDAIGLNRAEAFFRMGRYYYPPTLPSRIGCEGSGVVEAVGPGVSGLAPGDLVGTFPGPFSMSTNGVYGDRGILPAKGLLRRPEGLDVVTGAAVWAAYMTAYGALAEVGKVAPGDRVLITAASSSVGLAAIQIVNRLGGIPIATTRTREKVDQLLKAGAAHVIARSDGDLVEQVHAVTDGRGARLVFDPIAGPGLAEVARTVAPGGLLIVYSWVDPRPAPLPLTWPLNIHCYAHSAVTGDEDALRRAETFINEGLVSGALAPVVDRTFDLTEIVEAHRYLESNVQFGKIVVTVQH
ncbi:zinc-dependent alcohol dehydrogenase family protein [Micromonospora sp. SL1-18]|uniref:zinc-dependent alcohol dehydrogenase family protein n=1 Tax=Micromonospora sp. SL1-18 TaxID=3399128 RepID=UPI003A4E00A5